MPLASLEGLFENAPFLRSPFCAESRPIPPFSSKNVQIIAESWGFCDRFYQNVFRFVAREPPQQAAVSDT